MFLLWFYAYIYDFKGLLGKKFFFRNGGKNFFSIYPPTWAKNFKKIFLKNFFFQISLQIINVGTKPLQKYIFFKNFISKIFHN